MVRRITQADGISADRFAIVIREISVSKHMTCKAVRRSLCGVALIRARCVEVAECSVEPRL